MKLLLFYWSFYFSICFPLIFSYHITSGTCFNLFFISSCQSFSFSKYIYISYLHIILLIITLSSEFENSWISFVKFFFLFLCGNFPLHHNSLILCPTTTKTWEALQGPRRLTSTHPTAGWVVGGGWHVHLWQHWLLTHRWHHKVSGVCRLWAWTPWLARQHLQEELCSTGQSQTCLALL